MKSSPSSSPLIPLNHQNLRQYVDFLQDRFPGLTQRQISELASLRKDHITCQLTGRIKSIRIATAKAIMGVYEGLESGKMTYKPSKWEKREKRFKRGDAKIDKDNINQYIDFMQTTFSGLTIKTISELAGIDYQRLHVLTRGIRMIRTYEANALFQVYDDLKTGKKTYKPTVYGQSRFREQVRVNKKDLQKLVDDILEKYPQLSVKSISILCGVGDAKFHHVLNDDTYSYLYKDEYESLYRLIEDIRSGEIDIEEYGIIVHKENLKQLIDYLQKKYDGLGMREIEKWTGLKRYRLIGLLHNPKSKIYPKNVKALFELAADLEKDDVIYKKSARGVYRVSLDKGQLRQYIDFLKSKYNVSQAEIERIAGFTRRHITQLLNNNRIKNILPEHVETLFQVYEDLESGKELLYFTRTNPGKIIKDIQKKHPELSLRAISKLSKISQPTVHKLVNCPNAKFQSIIVKKVLQLSKRLESEDEDWSSYEQ